MQKTASIVCDPGKAPTKPLPTVVKNLQLSRLKSPRQLAIEQQEQQALQAEMALKMNKSGGALQGVPYTGRDISPQLCIQGSLIPAGKRVSESLLDGLYSPRPFRDQFGIGSRKSEDSDG